MDVVSTPRYDKIVSTLSWLIVFALLYSALSIALLPPIAGGPVVGAIGVKGAQYFYCTLYGSQALLLGYAKLRKKKSMRKKVLMFIYLTGFFTSILTITVAGWTPKLIDNVFISTAAAICWLHWKFKTEYIDQAYFQRVLEPLIEDGTISEVRKDA